MSAEVLLTLIPLLSYIRQEIWRKIAVVEHFSEVHSSHANFTVTVLFVTRDVTSAIQGNDCSNCQSSIGNPIEYYCQYWYWKCST
jgi:hypothetical protein